MYFMRRKIGQFIRVYPSPRLDPATPIGEVFKNPIGLLLIHSDSEGARFAVFGEERVWAAEEELMQPEEIL